MESHPGQRTAPAGRLFVLVVVLISACGLRLWRIEQPSIWHDEGWSIRAIRDPIGTPDDNTPPLYYGLMHVLWLGAGETPLALRYGSVLLDLITIALAARLMRRWARWDAVVLTAVLFACSPLLWAYAREIRAYVAVPLFTVLLLTLTDRLLAAAPGILNWRVWLMTLVVELALLYTHNLSVPVVGWLNVVIGAAWVWQRRWRALAIWLGGQAMLLLAYVPWLAGQSPSGTPLNTPPEVSPALIWKIWQGYFAPLPTMIGAERPVQIASALLGIAALGALVGLVLWQRRRRGVGLVLSQALLLPALATVELSVAHIDFHPRYYVAGVPAALLLIALGFDALPRTRIVRRGALAAGLALAVGTGALSLAVLVDRPQYQHDDFRAIAQYYATLPADAIILIPYGWEPALQEYYAKLLHIRAEIVGIPLHSSAGTAMESLNTALAARGGAGYVELLTWYQLPADVRGMYPCLLSAAGRPADTPPFTVQGLTTAGYQVDHLLEMNSIAFTAADYGAMLLDEAALSGQQRVCLRTHWTSKASIASNWRVSGRLVTIDPRGWLLARSDTDIRRDDQVPTSGWSAGQQGEAYSLLLFPDGTPPRDYRVQIVAFSGQQPGGIDQLVNGIPSGKSVTLATLHPAGVTDAVPAALPESASVTDDGLVRLAGHDAQGGLLTAGQELRITLQWVVNGDCCYDQPWISGTLALRGNGWETVQPVMAYSRYSLDWHAILVPADAEGAAVLSVEADGIEPISLADYTIQKTDRLFAPPPFDVSVGTSFAHLAVLEGFSVAPTTLTGRDTLVLTLVWRAIETPDASYRVFTHLLSDAGRVIAQQDDFPVGGTRPTTGWVLDEYIQDTYRLAFNDEGQQYHGAARLEVGFYDPETGQRVQLSNGADHVLLPIAITVQ